MPATRVKKTTKKTSLLPTIGQTLGSLKSSIQFLIGSPQGLAIVYLILGMSIFILSGPWDSTKTMIKSSAIALSESLGLRLEHIMVEGQEHTPVNDIIDIVDASIGAPLLSLDIYRMQQELKTLTWIKYVTVERDFPSTLTIRMLEYQPAAIWQHEGKLALIDLEGTVITTTNLHLFSDNIILVGKDARHHVTNFFSMINSAPNIRPLISSAQRIGERRWNIQLFNGIEIELPEKNPQKAWQFISSKHETDAILDQQVKSINLKVPNKMFIKK